MPFWTVVQHSAAQRDDPRFTRGLQEAQIESPEKATKILRAGGRVFYSYGEAQDYSLVEQYPGNCGMIPHAPGKFSKEILVGDLPLYLPLRQKKKEF